MKIHRLSFSVVLVSALFGLLHAQEWTEEKASQKTAASPAEPAIDAASLPGMAPAVAESAAKKSESQAEMESAPVTAESEPASDEPGGSYHVREGDTLWDLADRYYKNPYQWSRIWEANREGIRNPNLIYPDQSFFIPGKNVEMAKAKASSAVMEESADSEDIPSESVSSPESSRVEPVSVSPVEEAAAPTDESEPVIEEAPKPVKMAKLPPAQSAAWNIGNTTFVVDAAWQGDGKVIGDLEKKVMLSQDDIVFVNMGVSSGIKAKMRGTIYRKGHPVRDPETRARMGNAFRRVGTLQVTEQIGDENSTAVIVNSYEPIRVGDIVKLEK